MSFTIPAITITISQPILIIALLFYIVLSTIMVVMVAIASEIPFMGSGWKKNIPLYLLFFPGTIICLTIWAIIAGLFWVGDFLIKSKILR
jgi:hypothetical protein